MSVPLDPLIHSKRWNDEHIVRRAYESLWDWRRKNYGRHPQRVRVHYELRRTLTVNGFQSGAVSWSFSDPIAMTLFGIPIEATRDAAGFDWQ